MFGVPRGHAVVEVAGDGVAVSVQVGDVLVFFLGRRQASADINGLVVVSAMCAFGGSLMAIADPVEGAI